MWTAIRRLARKLATEHASPARLGVAVGVGVLIGVTPLFGLHLLLCITVATLLGLNRIVTYLAANISVPIIAPFLAFGSIQLGTYVREGEWLGVSLDAFTSIDPVRFAEVWLLGSLILGLLLGVPAGLATGLAVRLYRRARPIAADPISDAMRAVAARYDPVGRFAAGYVRGKLQHDPVYRQLAERLPFDLPVADLGCGRGQTALLVKQLQPEATVFGVDWAADKVDQARRAAAGITGLSFEVSDVRDLPVLEAGTILIIDVLHYAPIAVQDAILARAAAALKPGGRLLIRDLDLDGGWRARTTVWQERLGTAIGLNRGATLAFRPASEVVSRLEQLGLTADRVPSSADLPLANVLIEARRSAITTPAAPPRAAEVRVAEPERATDAKCPRA
jgi:SAM-dependent methyltransferase